MGIEPLGSIMTVQAQTAQKQPSPQQTEAKTEGNKEVTAPDKAPAVDVSTAAVANADSKEKRNSTEGESNERDQQAANDKIKKAVEQLNKNMHNSEAIFGIHDRTNRVTIKIIDRNTKDVLKEFPPEKTLDMIAKVWELAGILVDEKR